MLEFLRRPWLDSSEQVLTTFALVGLLIGLLAATGLLGRIAALGLRAFNVLLQGGFRIWEIFFSRLHWSLLLGIVLVIQGFAWFDYQPFPLTALLLGLLLLAVGVTACMAYIVIDQERFDVTRGYKVLYNPGKGQEVAERLLRHGPQAGLPLLIVACLATVVGFTLLNLGMYDFLGPKWCVVGNQRRIASLPEAAPDGPTVERPAHYSDFLAYSLLHLLSALDLIDVLNHNARLARIAYVHPSNPVAVVLQTLFRTFFTAVLLRQLFAWYRDRRLLTDSLRDFWAASEPIQRRASETLAQQGVEAARALLRSVQKAPRLTPEQQSLLPDVLAAAGPSVVPLLVRSLKQPQEMVREVAVAALGRLQAIEALPELERTAADPAVRVRLQVAATLGEIFTPGPAIVRKRWKLRTNGVRRRRWLQLRRPSELAGDPAERGVVVLRRLTRDGERSVRVAALDALRALGKEAAPAVIDLAQLAADEGEEVRERVAVALGTAHGDAEAAVPALLRLLEDPIPRVRLAAARAVGVFGDNAAPAIPILIPLLQDAEDEIRHAAAAAIADIGTLDARSLPRLTAGLRSRDNVVQARAAEAVGSIGPTAAAAVPVLIELLKDDSDRVRQRAAWALGQMEDASAAVALGEALRDEDFRVAASAADALGRLGPAAASATPALLQAAKHINAVVRCNTASALASVGTGERVVTTLLALTGDAELEVQLAAIAALGRFEDKMAQQRLCETLTDGNPRVRVATVRALQSDGLDTAKLVTVLLPLLDDANEDVVVEVLAGLGRLDKPSSAIVARIAQLLQDDREAVQLAAARALGQFGTAAVSASQGLLLILQRGSARVREQALRTLLQVEPPELLGACLAALHDADEGVRRLASAGLVLAAPLPNDALPPVVEAMKDSDAQVRSNLAMVLAKQEQLPIGVLPSLLRALEDPDDGLRLNALRALQESPEHLVAVLPRLLADPNGQVALLAASCWLRHDPRSVEAGALLEKALTADVVRDRRHAVETLERLGGEGQRFREAVARQLQVETEPDLREAMTRWLSEP